MTVDAEKLLLVQGSKELTQGGLTAASLSHEKYRLVVLEALVEKDR